MNSATDIIDCGFSRPLLIEPSTSSTNSFTLVLAAVGDLEFLAHQLPLDCAVTL